MVATLTRERVAAARASVISNWAPTGVGPPRRGTSDDLRAAWGLSGKFVVAYSGNLGRVHDVGAIALLADALRADADVHFLIIGGGAQREHLEDDVSRRGLNNVTFRPLQPRGRLSESLAVGDLHLVTLRLGCERFVYPSKLYGIAAVGRPILFVGPHESAVARCVVENRLGGVATRDNIAKGAAFVRWLLAEPAQRAACSQAALRFAAAHDLSAAAAKWEALIRRLDHVPSLPRPANFSGTP